MTASRRRRRLSLVALLVFTATLLSSCGDSDKELNTFDPQGPTARDIYNLMNPVYLIAGVVLLIVFGMTLYMIVKFRASKHPDDDLPEQLHGHMKAELGWTILPALILATVAVF